MKATLLFSLLFFAGLIVGLGLGRILEDSPEDTGLSVVPGAESQETTTSLNYELSRLRVQIANQASQIKTLEEELQAARQPELVSSDESGSEETRREEFEERIRARLESRMQGRVDEMAAKYGLTAAQQDTLKDLLRRRFEHFRDLRSGDASGPFDMDAELQKVFSEEQFAAYLEESQQEIYNRAEVLATSQVVRLSQIVDLAPEVQDIVYETIHLTAQEMMIARQAGDEFDMRGILDSRLSNVLTSDQLAAYRESMRGPGREFIGP